MARQASVHRYIASHCPCCARAQLRDMPMLTARVIHTADYPAIDELRIASYRRATWYTLHAAVAAGIRSIIAGQARGTPNLRVMAELGYRVFNVKSSSMSQVRINTEHVLSYLPAQDFALALERLGRMLGEVLSQVVWRGEALGFAEWLKPVAQRV